MAFHEYSMPSSTGWPSMPESKLVKKPLFPKSSMKPMATIRDGMMNGMVLAAFTRDFPLKS